MIKCTGICSKCGRCQNSANINKANSRKTKMLNYPEDFSASESAEGYGAAFDIGTTTVVGMLWDLKAGRQAAVCAATNPQNEFGLDVISRITYCNESEGNLDILRGRITECLNDIITDLCQKAQINRKDICKVTVAGNTTMSHIFAGYSPRTLALAPFTPAYEGALKLSAEEAMLETGENAEVVILPNIAGHVGGDITAGIIAARILNKKDLTLFIDIGTNGEIVLADGKRRFACSTAAGPAFEGTVIKYGMRAAAGAIERVAISDGSVEVKTIDEKEAVGICGSGLIDAVAQMVKAGLVNKKGRILSAEDIDKKGLNSEYKKRITEMEKQRQFVLVFKEDGNHIAITQNDIREVQLAKGAIYAGIEIMLKAAGKTAEQIKEIIVAGAFGSYIDKKSAVTIGLLPDIDTENIISAGNAAGCGVSMALVNEDEMKTAEMIPSLVEHIELADDENFQSVYMKSMLF